MAIKKTKEEFISRSLEIHGKCYDYSNVVYVNNKTKVEIICHIHGSFFQTPNDHIGNHGCSLCQKQNRKNYNLKEAYSEKNKDFPVSLYVVEITTSTNTFLKVGISKDTKQRFKNLSVKTTGLIREILVYPCTLQEATLLEDNILSLLKINHQITFSKKFAGYTECLNVSAKNEIIENIKNFVNDTKSDLVGKILDAEYGN